MPDRESLRHGWVALVHPDLAAIEHCAPAMFARIRLDDLKEESGSDGFYIDGRLRDTRPIEEFLGPGFAIPLSDGHQ